MEASGPQHERDPTEGWADDAPAGPMTIIDFLGRAESVVERLGSLTGVPAWLLVRRLGEEWIVLAGHSEGGLLPGDALTHPPTAARSLSAVARAWEGDVTVDLSTGRIEPGAGVGDASPVTGDGFVAFPLWADEHLFGAVCALPATPEEWSVMDQTEPLVHLVIELLTSVLGLDLERNRLQRRLDAAESAALSDPLTGLGNRRALDRAVRREEARCARFAHLAGILVLDLDGLKAVNDADGHAAGDELLRRVASSIRSTLRRADQAFRVGGDEFALLLPEVSAEGVTGVRDRLVAALESAGVSASIGCAVRRPGGADLPTCARAADAAMYAAKRQRAAAAAPRGGAPAV